MHNKTRSNNPPFKLLSSGALGLAVLLAAAPTAFAANEITLGAASNFALLSAAPDGAGAVSCTDSIVNGNVGSTGSLTSVAQVGCMVTGAVVAPVPANVVDDFYSTYNALADQSCDYFIAELDGQVLDPGTYCFTAASTTTDGVLTLNGSSTDTWLFKIGTDGTGALTGTNFDIALSNGAQACNVTWWVAEAVTMTTSSFSGVVLAGGAITMTGGSAESLALATAGVTLTNVGFLACEGGSIRTTKPNHSTKEHSKKEHSKKEHSKKEHSKKEHSKKERCNQGVGNGAESCDPGKSNHGDSLNSNDELGGTAGKPGRKKS